MNQETQQNRKRFIGYFIISFLLVFVSSFLILFFVEKEVRTTQVEAIKTQENRVVALENDYVGREFRMILSDLHYLHHAFESDLVNGTDYEKIAQNWVPFSSQRLIYDQIRYIDVQGDEKIRINLAENGAYIVPNSELQNKSDRYYFIETIQLTDESVYISPLDLNVELGKVEIPYKPMIRFSTPVFDENHQLKGIIVLNYLAEDLLSVFRVLAENSQGEMILLNSNAYRLSSDTPEKDWNFMFDETKGQTFESEFPEIWKFILEGNTQVATQDGFFTIAPVILSHKLIDEEMKSHGSKIVFGDVSWYIVSVIDQNQKVGALFNQNVWTMILDVLIKNSYYFIVIAIISALVGFLVYVNRKTYVKIKYFSEFDSLTKSYNRRAGINKLNELFPLDERRHFLVSLCFIDINGLKEVNDTLGHKKGDELIQTVAEVIKNTIRKQDFLIRLGGDEFLIVFSGIKIDVAETIWNRIVQVYDRINLEEDRAYLISVSHGVVDFDNQQKAYVDDLIHSADEKMYHEKKIIKANLSVIKSSVKNE